MDGLTIYALCVTVVAVVATTGFYYARHLLLLLCEVELEDWATVRGILRDGLKKGQP